MGELVPEKRMDKNGVLVTKHVRAMTASKALNVPLPKVDDTDERARKLFDSIHNRSGLASKSFVTEVQREIESRRTSVPAMGRTLLTLHAQTLDRLEASKISLNEITDHVIAGVRNGSFITLNNLAVLRDSCGDVSNSDSSWLIRGLNSHRRVRDWKDYGDATEDELAAPRAVLRAATALDGNFIITDRHVQFPTMAIRSSLLIDLIESRPKDVDRIVAIVNERRPVMNDEGISGITELLDSGTHDAVLDGAL